MENGETLLATFESQSPRARPAMKEKDHLVVTDQGVRRHRAAGCGSPSTTSVSRPAILAVRKAIAYAVDRDFIINALLLGAPTEARTGFHPGSPFYEPNVEPYDLDIDKANRILDEAGVRRGATTACASSCSSTSAARSRGPTPST